MKLITRDSDYAIRALTCIATDKDKIHTVTELTKNLDIPRPFLRKILQTLNHKGTLQSHKGRGGGFVLETAPSKINILDIVETFQGPFHLDEHILKKKVCPRVKTCVLKKKIDKIEKSVAKDLKAITVASLIEK